MQPEKLRVSTSRLLLAALLAVTSVNVPLAEAQEEREERLAAKIAQEFDGSVKGLLRKFCVDCHSVDNMESGIRVDHLEGTLPERSLKLWEAIRRNLDEATMPPKDSDQPTDDERSAIIDWIDRGFAMARSRPDEKNGSTRRLTVAQYQNTLRDLLGIEENVTDVLPPDAVSADGFLNNGQTLELSPLLLEAYFNIAEKALDLCIVDETAKPQIQNFRMDLGAKINPKPCPDNLILGALSMLLKNDDFVVTQLEAKKPFEFEPFFMRTKYRFIEGYQGNATVRGWREYDSIYHSVFACMRGNGGYPKGKPYETIPEGLLLRPAIPSAELFQVESTYGPKANFKISLRELPDTGRFRVTVRAARYDDGLLLDADAKPASSQSAEGRKPSGLAPVVVKNAAQPQTVNVEHAGIYQVDVSLQDFIESAVEPNDSRLAEGLIGAWPLDGDATSRGGEKEHSGELVGGAKYVESPFGQAVSFDGADDAVVTPRDESMNVGEGEFTVAAWIRPTELRQGGIVCLGRYNYTHGWYFDMPGGNGVLRIETMNPNSQLNGKVQTRPGVIRRNEWQHVAAVVRRGKNSTRLYINGYEVAVGTINDANLDNPTTSLHIGRIEGGNLFKGDIDEVRLYRRALNVAELQALVEPGRRFAKPPPNEPRKNLSLTLGDRHFSGLLKRDAFLAVRLPAGPLQVEAKYEGKTPVDRMVLTPLDGDSEVAQQFARFEKRAPRVGVHVGLRRDCGSTLNPVGKPQAVTDTGLQEFVFEGAISNFPSPDVEKDNVNYLAGIREIGVRSEYTDGRDMPRLLIRSVEFEGPYYETWPPRTHRDIFIKSPNENDPTTYAREVISRFATRAFRRPVTDDELTSLLAVFNESLSASTNFHHSVRDALLVVLTSPQFLFLIENSGTPKAEPLDNHELASKLSYFLWNTAPDEGLLEQAAAGSLRTSLADEAARLIGDPRFDQFAEHFVSQWLNLDKVEIVEINRKKFPKLTRDTKSNLRDEPVEFLKHLIRKNLPLRNLIQSDFVIANEVVASYYGLADRTESGFEFVPVAHNNPQLGGVLTQAAILAGLSNGREPNAVKRGAWFARKIIAEPPAPPPPNVPGIPEDDDSELTLAQKLERHRTQKGCLKCHSGIDPWGIPFEQYDAGGLFRSTKPEEALSELPDKTEVNGVNELKRYLIEDRIDQVAFSVLKHLAIYATGRSLTWNEIDFLKRNGPRLKADGYRMQDMVQFVVNSPMFLEK
ncbi:MAG: DUF1592 domain-containing protein [Planctomycetota bacterium]|jgi:hypothetical protein